MSIELSNRATRVLSSLLKGRKLTPRAVARFSQAEVLLQRGCGRATFIEIERWLLEHALTLRFSYELIISHKSRKAGDLLWLAEKQRDLIEFMAWNARRRQKRNVPVGATLLRRVLASFDRAILKPNLS